MSTDPLAQMSDIQLMNLFSANANASLSQRAKQIVAELEQRGFIYDLRRGDFIPCEEWNKRHGDYAPMDCHKQRQNLGRY